MKRCGIAFETMADYQEGRLDANATAQVREHLDRDCVSCRQNLAWLQRATDTLRAAQSVHVPASALTRAGTMFRERFRPAAASNPSSSNIPFSNPLTAWLARLQFDSRNSTPAMAGARGAKRDGVQLVYSTEAHDIDLFQEPNAQGGWYLIGQVMPREGEAIIVPNEIVLTGQDGSRLVFRPDGEEFHLPSIPQGVYQIALRLADGDITLPDVGVGQ